MRRFLIIFALALIPVQGLIYFAGQQYSMPLSFEAATLRMIGGAAVAGYVAWRIDRQLGGRKKTAPKDVAPSIYQRPTADQLANLGGTTGSGAEPSAETGPTGTSAGSLRDRLRQNTGRD